MEVHLAEEHRMLKDLVAKFVRDQLTAAGIAPDRITLDKPQQTTGSGDLADARRVEVTVLP